MKRLKDEHGVALVAALLVTMMMTAMLAGFLAMVNADQAAGGIDHDQTQAYAAAHAGVEKLTADLGALFAGNFSPTGAQVRAASTQPNLPGIRYVLPNDPTLGSGYRITFTDVNPADDIPDAADPNGTPITSPPYDGLVGLITPYQVEVTARTAGNAEVRMRRTMQTIAIPVFQFGIFSENNLSFFAGPNFGFGGRVHTNQNLFLKQENGATLTLSDRVTAVGEVIRTHLSNGITGTHAGTVRMARAAGCPAAPIAANGNCFTLAANRGSLVGTLGSAPNNEWANTSRGDSAGWLTNGLTGAKRLDLPLVSDGATPVDIIRRPPVGEAVTSVIGRQRFYNMATLRILMSDQAADLVGPTGPPGTVFTAGVSPIQLTNTALFVPNPAVPGFVPGLTPFAASTGVANDGYRTRVGVPSIGGYILINMQNRNGTWTDVTREVLSLGFSGRRLSNGTLDVPDFDNNCADQHPNAIIRVQRIKDQGGCTVAGGDDDDDDDDDEDDDEDDDDAEAVLASNYWPNVLYDPREGMLRDDEGARPTAPVPVPQENVAAGQARVTWGGVMHYVELDVNNLRRWLSGATGTSGSAGCALGAGPTTCPMDITGFVVYFSDRRGNRNRGADGAVEPPSYNAATGFTYLDDRETGEFGADDIINPGSSTGAPNGVLDGPFLGLETPPLTHWAEDVNDNGVVDSYGSSPRLMPPDIGVGLTMLNVVGQRTPLGNAYGPQPVDRAVARVNRAFFFRRALKLVNGGRGNLPANGSQGLTVAAENPVYIQGNYNACANTVTSPPNTGNNFQPACAGGVGFGGVPGTDHVSAAVIADAVTLLSNAWNDIRSFRNPHNAGTSGLTNPDARQAATTWYRVALIAGKGLSFPRPTNNATDGADFGTDGGAHNFLRYIENWGGRALNYRGSLISFYTSRQAVGTYKCCDIVYSPPSRGYNFDTEFLTPSLLPPRTPMFRDINTLTFRQILRPTQ